MIKWNVAVVFSRLLGPDSLPDEPYNFTRKYRLIRKFLHEQITNHFISFDARSDKIDNYIRQPKRTENKGRKKRTEEKREGEKKRVSRDG